MTIVTIASHRPVQPYYVYDEFFVSARRFWHEPVVLGHGEYRGLGSKPRILKKFLESSSADMIQWMIFCDSFDVVFQDDPVKIHEEFGKHAMRLDGHKIIWNAERKCFPNTKLAEKFPESRSSYRFLNSGFAYGNRETFIEALKEMKADEIPDDHQNPDGSWNNPNDQELWQKEYLFGNVPMGLDTKCEMCQTLSDVNPDELDFSEEKIRNKETGAYPVAFHLNGRKEEWKPLILNHLKL